jgi:alanine dehydrogenase
VHTATIVGCGVQGELQLAAITTVLPLRRILVVDIDHARAEDLATRAAAKHDVRIEPTKNLRDALRDSDVCVTCTTSRRPFLEARDISPGTFIAAVGADSPEKQELEPSLLASATLKSMSCITPWPRAS